MRFNASAEYFGAGSARRGDQQRSQRSHRIPTVPRNEREVMQEISGVLRRWGIDPDSSFAKKATEVAAKCFNCSVIDDWEPFASSLSLPSDTEEALRILLKHNLTQVTKNGVQTTKTETHDLINDKYDAFLPFPPYNDVRGELRLSWAYKELNLDVEDLHPLKRFSYEKKDIKEYMLDQFGQAPDDEYPPHFVRALVLHEAVCGFHQCLACKKKGTLLWNSSMRSDFSNLVCSECSSVYTLCCVASSQRVQKLFDKGIHHRGSYAHFCQRRSEMRSNGKMYVVFASRSFVDSEEGRGGLPVFVAEIKGALPNLNSDSFDLERIRIKSNIVFEPINARAPWFSVCIPRDIDILGLSMEVFHCYFDSQADGTSEEDETKPQASPALNQSCVDDDGKQRQINNLKKFLAEINDIRVKQKGGANLEKWETALLGREQKLLKKLAELGAEE